MPYRDEIRRGRYQTRFWRRWWDWVPSPDRLVLPGLDARIRQGRRQGFAYQAVEWVDATGRVVFKLEPGARGLECWHHNRHGPGFHRHGTVAWDREPAAFWIRHLRALDPDACPV